MEKYSWNIQMLECFKGISGFEIVNYENNGI